MRVFLIGFMASGKSSVGRSLARRLRTPLVDLDREIEARAGVTVAEIFARGGEPEFRRLEREALLAAVESGPSLVMATGGGTFTVAENEALISECGTSVWLDVPLPELLERLGEDDAERPLFRDPDQAARLYGRRLPAYRRCDLRIAAEAGEGAGRIADRIACRLEEKTCVS